ncbi:MAG TPA: MFS transporter [Methylomirabilota bacterium]|nr:MFS transporter [Methylomirabilota bacterium]
MLSGEFRKLWIGQSISAIGSSVTFVALPLTAAFNLNATPQQMGLLVAAGWLPYLFFSLFAGAWSDRLPRKPILVVTDLARAAILVTIPLAAVAGVLRIEHVLIAAFVAGSMTVLFRAAYGPFIPALVGRDALVDANAKLALSESVARVVGPSLGGLLVQLITAPFAILADALSFVVSAVAVAAVRVSETPPRREERRSIWSEIGDGITVVIANPFIRTVAIIGLLFNVAITIGEAVYVLYATRGLGLDGAMLGVVYTVGGLASVAGATLVRRTTSRFGIGPSMVGSILLLTVAGLLVLAAGGPPIAAAAYFAARGAMTGFAASVFNVTSNSVYQAAIPNRLQGRVAGAGQVLGLGLIPVSAIVGGWLGENVGLWNTLAISIGCQFLAFVYVALSPLRGIRTATDFPAVA